MTAFSVRLPERRRFARGSVAVAGECQNAGRLSGKPCGRLNDGYVSDCRYPNEANRLTRLRCHFQTFAGVGLQSS